MIVDFIHSLAKVVIREKEKTKNKKKWNQIKQAITEIFDEKSEDLL
jgi:hypothetical protein